MALLLGVCFSMNTAINSSNSISRASNRARLSALILPSTHSDSKRALSASNSARSEDLFTVAIAAQLPNAKYYGKCSGLQSSNVLLAIIRDSCSD